MAGKDRGRPAIERGDVQSRAFWDQVAIDEPDSEHTNARLTDTAQLVHWFWLGNPSGIAGVTSSTYDKPVRVLFHELRQEEYDKAVTLQGKRQVKPNWARFRNDCGLEECVNPHHWTIKTATDLDLTLADIAERVKGGHSFSNEPLYAEEPFGQTVRMEALQLYVFILRHADTMSDLIRGDGEIDTASSAYRNDAVAELRRDPRVHAELVSILAQRPLPTEKEANTEYWELSDAQKDGADRTQSTHAALNEARNRSGLGPMKRQAPPIPRPQPKKKPKRHSRKPRTP